jgi:hypothetical protein
MRFRYSTTDPRQGELDSLPRIPLILRSGGWVSECVGLVDSGATVNVLPYDVGVQLGAVWDDAKASLNLAGTLGSQIAIPLFATAEIEGLPAVKLAFAWIKKSDAPLILGQANFFMEFDVHFYRSKLEFDIVPKTSPRLV